MKHSFQFSILTLMLAATFSPSTFAAQPKQSDAAQQALKKAQGVLKQLGEEKAALEAEKKTLSDEKTVLQSQVEKLESALKQISPLQAEVAAQKSAVNSLRNSNGALSSQLSRSQENERELNKKLQETVALAKLIQNDNQLLVSAVQERERWIGHCDEKNRDVIHAANELTTKYQNKSFLEKLSEVEPFTGIGNVEMENTVQNYQFKLEDLKVTAFEKETTAPR
jgi:chromosome segregation ATPase